MYDVYLHSRWHCCVSFLHIDNLFSVALRPNAGHGLLILEVSRSHTTTHHSRQDSSGLVISSSQRPLPDNTQHSQQTDTHAPGGIRTHNLSRRAAADLRLRQRGYWDRHISIIKGIKINIQYNSSKITVKCERVYESVSKKLWESTFS